MLRKVFALTVLMAVTGGISPAMAQEVHADLVKVSNFPDVADLPPDYVPRPIHRYFGKVAGGMGDHMSMNLLPYGYEQAKFEYTLGNASYNWFPGAHELYVCMLQAVNPGMTVDRFTSTDPNCEGRVREPNHPAPLGWVASTQLPGTVPIYRCLIRNAQTGQHDHFDTIHANCEAHPTAVNEGALGYLFP